MKKLGLVGGMGPESTIPYYHGIVYGVQERVGSTAFFPELTIESVDLFRTVDLCARRDYAGLTDYLSAALEHLAAAGADFAALASNTPHIVFPQLQARSPLPLVSIVEAACLEAERRGYRKLGLLGTIFTMDEDFFKRPFRDRGMGLAVPSEQERRYINEKIYGELELGVLREDTRAEFLRIVRRMRDEDGIQAVILGCTELPLLFRGAAAAVPCLDTMELHIRTLVDRIVDG